MKDEAQVSGGGYETNIPHKIVYDDIMINSFIISLKTRQFSAILNVNVLRAHKWNIVIPTVKVLHYILTNKIALFSAPDSTKWRSSNNTLSASPVFALTSNQILFFIYLPQQKRRGRQVIRISVFDFSSFKGVFVNVGRWWLRLYFGSF